MGRLKSWWLLALAFAAGFGLAVLVLGRYEFKGTAHPGVTYRMDRLTGAMEVCDARTNEDGGCRTIGAWKAPKLLNDDEFLGKD